MSGGRQASRGLTSHSRLICGCADTGPETNRKYAVAHWRTFGKPACHATECVIVTREGRQGWTTWNTVPGSCSNSTGVLASCLDLGKCHDCHHGLLVEGMRLLFDGCIGNLELYCEVSLLRTCF